MKGLGERQGQELQGSLDKGIDPADSRRLGRRNQRRQREQPQRRFLLAALGLWPRHRRRLGGSTCGAACARKRPPRKPTAPRSKPTTNSPASRSPPPWRARISPTIEAAQQEANAQETLKLYEDYSKLTDERKKQGHASDFDVAQIKSRTAGARDTLYAAQAARAQAIRAIEVVTSHYPAGKLGVRRSFPGQPKAVPAGLPAQILERRPDLVAAERRFAAAFHRTNEARTARLPRFALSATGGLGSAQLDTVGVLDAVTWSLAAGVIQPIFFGGELKAAQDIRTAEQKAAVASYVGVALRAFEDVEDALAGDYYLRKREGALNEMVDEQRRRRETRPRRSSTRARPTCSPSCASPARTSPRRSNSPRSAPPACANASTSTSPSAAASTATAD